MLTSPPFLELDRGEIPQVKSYDRQVLHQVRLTRKVVCAICRFLCLAPGFDLQSHAAHQTLHPFSVDHPALTVQLRRNAAIAMFPAGKDLGVQSWDPYTLRSRGG